MLGLNELTSKPEKEDYYKVLGCCETSTENQILAEYRLLARKFHPDKNPDNSEALCEFKKLQEARDILTDPEKRKSYDTWRRSEINISFKKWQNFETRCQMTMHWAKPKTQAMLECPSNTKTIPTSVKESIDRDIIQFGNKSTSWEAEKSFVYGKFRRYEI